jgi:glucose/mannose-6-phosphate isomerase
MTNLDTADLRLALDTDGAYERNRHLPEQCRDAWEAVRDLALPHSYRDIDHVIVAGMGGSAIAGDFLQALCFRDSVRPVTVLRGYRLPAWASSRTLFIACSHSGSTEETLTAFSAALHRGCKLVAVTTGGELLSTSEKMGSPALTYNYYAEPRSAFGHGFLRLLAIARNAGFLDVSEDAVEEAIASIEALEPRLKAECPESSNPAKQLARRIHGRLPLIIGSEFLAPVARRWKNQINENAGSWAVDEELPELHHNAVVGFGLPRDTADSIHTVILRHAALSERVLLRCQITAELLQASAISHEYVEVPGEDTLAAMLGGVYIGSMVSYYLAMLNGVRPSEIDNINYLKSRLA